MSPDDCLLDRYFLDSDDNGEPRRLGKGSQGTVFKGSEFSGSPDQMEKVRDVAIKLFPVADQHQRRRFDKEVAALERLDHSAIVRILAHGEHEGRLCLVTEYVDGAETLQARIADGPLSARSAVQLLTPIAEALRAIHACGIAHRDVSPKNILCILDATQSAKLIDFGWATAPRSPDDETFSVGLVGTLPCMSPEAASSDRAAVDHWSDIWSFGAVLFFAITKAFPYWERGLPTEELVSRLRHDPPRIELLRQAECSVILIRILERCFERIPCRRWTAAELVRELEEFLRDGEQHRLSPLPLSRRFLAWRRENRKWADLVLAAFASVIIMLLILVPPLLWKNAQLVRTNELLIDESRKKDAALWGQRTANASLDQTNHELRKETIRAGEQERLAKEEALSARQHSYVDRMLLAQQALEGGQRERAIDLLEGALAGPGEQDLRGIEWSLLWQLAHSDHTAFQGHEGIVQSVAFSPDGRTLASSSWDGTVRTWNPVDGTQRLAIGTENPRPILAWSPDGLQIAASLQKTGVWNSLTGQHQLWLKEPINIDVTCLAFSPDGSRLATGRRATRFVSKHSIPVFDLAQGELVQELDGHDKGVRCLAFSRDGKRLISGGEDGQIGIWSMESSTRLKSLMGHEGIVSSIVFSPDGSRFASASWDGTVRIWDADSGEPLKTHPMNAGMLRTLVYLPDGETLVTAGEGREILFLDAESGRRMGAGLPHPDMIWSLAISSDGTRLVSSGGQPRVVGDVTAGGAGGLIKVWELPQRREYQPIVAWEDRAAEELVAPTWTNSLCLSQDGETLIAGLENGQLQTWSRSNGRFESRDPLPGDSHSLSAVFSLYRPHRCLTADDAGTLQVWNTDGSVAGKLRASLGYPFFAMAASTDGRWCATCGGGDHIFAIWSTEDLVKRGFNQTGPSPYCALAFSSDAKRVAAGDRLGAVRILNRETLATIAEYSAHAGDVHAVAFSADGHWLLSTGGDRSAILYDCVEQRIRHRLTGHLDEIRAGLFTPDSRRILTASWDRTVKVWDVATGLEVLTLRGARHPLGPLTLSADAQTLFVGVQAYPGRKDGQVLVWKAASNEQVWQAATRRHSRSQSPADDRLTIARLAWSLARTLHGGGVSTTRRGEWLMEGHRALQQRLSVAPHDVTARRWTSHFDKELEGHRSSPSINEHSNQ